MGAKECIELGAVSTMLAGVILLLYHRIHTGKGIGARAIQAIAITGLAPLLLILALENILDGPTVGALVGTLFGYLFGRFGEFEARTSKNSLPDD